MRICVIRKILILKEIMKKELPAEFNQPNDIKEYFIKSSGINFQIVNSINPQSRLEAFNFKTISVSDVSQQHISNKISHSWS